MSIHGLGFLVSMIPVELVRDWQQSAVILPNLTVYADPIPPLPSCLATQVQVTRHCLDETHVYTVYYTVILALHPSLFSHFLSIYICQSLHWQSLAFPC